MLEYNFWGNTVIYRLINNGLSFWCLLFIPTYQNSKPLYNSNSYFIS